MVNGVSSNSVQDWRAASNIPINRQSNNIESTMKAGSTIKTENSDTFADSAKWAVGSAALFEGIPLYRYMKHNKKAGGVMTSDMNKLSDSTQSALKNIKEGTGKLSERIGEYFKVVNKNKELYGEIKNIAQAKAHAPELAVKAENAALKASENPSLYREWKAKRAKSSAEKALKTAEKTVNHSAKAAEEMGLKKIVKSSGAKVLFVLSGIIEGITEVIPTFQELGFEKGMKQLGKSTVKVLGDTAGFIAGQQAGMAVGSAIGTAICPGVGTAIGAAVGLACGMIGSYAADKLTKSVVGKSELEIAKEQQENNQMQYNRNNVFAATV